MPELRTKKNCFICTGCLGYDLTVGVYEIGLPDQLRRLGDGRPFSGVVRTLFVAIFVGVVLVVNVIAVFMSVKFYENLATTSPSRRFTTYYPSRVTTMSMSRVTGAVGPLCAL